MSSGPKARLQSVDLLRGLVIVLMAIDHTREYFTNADFDPLDLHRTTPGLFLTRWITHLCAPTFCFLAGSGAYLYQSSGRTRGELSKFLLTRGLWLIFLELTWLNWFAWSFYITFHHFIAVVIWSLGWSMVALAGLVWLPSWAITVIGLVICAGHNLTDGIKPESFGAFAGLWRVAHAGGHVQLLGGVDLDVQYRLIPWIGVMALGYAFGAIVLLDRTRRRRAFVVLGASLIVLFVIVRLVNSYGDPDPWSGQSSPLFTLFSFINCHKYPPSLDYLLMTLGPALLILAALDGESCASWPILRPVLVFGQVPLFFFLIHIPVARAASLVVNWLRFGRADWLYGPPDPTHQPPPGAGFSLPVVYLAWIILLVALYPLCRWFADLKRRKKSRWLSYL